MKKNMIYKSLLFIKSNLHSIAYNNRRAAGIFCLKSGIWGHSTIFIWKIGAAIAKVFNFVKHILQGNGKNMQGIKKEVYWVQFSCHSYIFEAYLNKENRDRSHSTRVNMSIASANVHSAVSLC
jgi:hypothetical protein